MYAFKESGRFSGPDREPNQHFAGMLGKHSTLVL